MSPSNEETCEEKSQSHASDPAHASLRRENRSKRGSSGRLSVRRMPTLLRVRSCKAQLYSSSSILRRGSNMRRERSTNKQSAPSRLVSRRGSCWRRGAGVKRKPLPSTTIPALLDEIIGLDFDREKIDLDLELGFNIAPSAIGPAADVQDAVNLQTQFEPPDGGLEAWLQVLACFLCWFNSVGLANTFGEFQTYYSDHLLLGNTSSQIAWIGSMQAFLSVFFGVVTGPIYDAGYGRCLLWTGLCFTTLGYFMTSASNRYWQLMLTQGLLTGLGSGCFYIPVISIIPQYFAKRRLLANGMAACGSSLGGVIYPIMFRQLLPLVGFGWAVRVIALVILTTSLIAMSLFRVRGNVSTRRISYDFGVLKEPTFAFLTLGLTLAMTAIYTPLFYIQDFAKIKIGLTGSLPAFILPILNTGAILGRLSPSFFASRPLCMMATFVGALALSTLSWIGVGNESGLIIFAIIYGFFSGAILSLQPMAIISLSPSLGAIGSRVGTCAAVYSMGYLIGPPISGIILGNPGTNSFIGLQAFTGIVLAVSSVLFLVAALLKR